MPSSLLIRPVVAGDRSAWHDMWTAYLAFYETDLPEDVKATAFNRLLSDDPASFSGLVAEQEGALLGLTHYVLHPHLWKPEGVCYLQDLYTAPAARGKGVGRALIETVYDQADAAGVPNVYWLTQEFNATARRLYDSIADVTPFIKYSRRAS